MWIDFTSPNRVIEGKFAVLERGLSVPNPEWLVPDEVVEYCAERWDLLEPGKVGIDPFAGTASIPDVINRMGGTCDANEIDPAYCSIAEARLPDNSLLRQGDYWGMRTPGFYWGYDYVYTSPPFAYFIGDKLDAGRLAFRLRSLLFDEASTLIIDSAAVAVRDGVTVYPAAYTTLYFQYHGFRLKDWVSFTMPPKDGCDDQFTELLFARQY